MEYIALTNGTKYRLAVNGFLASETKVDLKLVTNDPVEQVAGMFNVENTSVLKVVNDNEDVIAQASGFVKRGSVSTKSEDAVISVKVIHEVKDEEGNITTPAGIEEEKGCIVAFSMYKETVEEKVDQNRADIDYLLMLGGEV